MFLDLLVFFILGFDFCFLFFDFEVENLIFQEHTNIFLLYQNTIFIRFSNTIFKF